MFNDFDTSDFDNVLDRVTSNDDTIVGLLDEDDFKLVKPKSNVTVSNDDFDKDDDMDVTTTSSIGFDPSEFADPDEPKSVTKTPPTVVSTGGYKNKMAHAKAIYEREAAKGPITRKQMMALFQSEAGCTLAGASTYFQTLNKK